MYTPSLTNNYNNMPVTSSINVINQLVIFSIYAWHYCCAITHNACDKLCNYSMIKGLLHSTQYSIHLTEDQITLQSLLKKRIKCFGLLPVATAWTAHLYSHWYPPHKDHVWREFSRLPPANLWSQPSQATTGSEGFVSLSCKSRHTITLGKDIWMSQWWWWSCTWSSIACIRGWITCSSWGKNSWGHRENVQWSSPWSEEESKTNAELVQEDWKMEHFVITIEL